MISTLITDLPNNDIIQLLFDDAVLNEYDISLVLFLKEKKPNISDDFLLLILWLSWATRKGHSCLNFKYIDYYKNQMKLESTNELMLPFPDTYEDLINDNPFIAESPNTSNALLVYKNDKLYFSRHFENELQISQKLHLLATNFDQTINIDRETQSFVDSLFEGFDGTERQKMACYHALLSGLTVITGGPGTGKTHTVLRLLSLLIRCEISSNKPAPKIAIAAPTGKAAARVKESIREGLNQLPIGQELKKHVPEDAKTIHRLLGYRHMSTNFKHNESHPLPYDIIIIDEASMIDLSMMAKLLAAIKPNAKLVLLGDKNQLASVEGGAVFADICSASNRKSLIERILPKIHQGETPIQLHSGDLNISDSVVELTYSHRFKGDSGIGLLASAVNNGDSKEMFTLLNSSDFNDIKWVENPIEFINGELKNSIKEQFSNFASDTNSEVQKLTCLNRFQILSAQTSGKYGVNSINSIAENFLGLSIFDSRVYNGKPIIVRKNDYNIGVFNGDVGIVIKHNESLTEERFHVIFEQPDEESGNRMVNKINTSLISNFETAWALTIHKSQGSEYDKVVIFLPEQHSPLLTRELLYTAITRARKKVTICGKKQHLETAVKTETKRLGGLTEAILELVS